MQGLTIASTWITFAALLAGIILLVLYSKYAMMETQTDAIKIKTRQLGMAGFWVLVVGLIFGLIAAISSSCAKSRMRDLVSDVAQRVMQQESLPRILPQ